MIYVTFHTIAETVCGEAPQVEYTISHMSSSGVGGTVTYQCDDGYQEVGGSSSKSCVVDGSGVPNWVGDNLQCQGKSYILLLLHLLRLLHLLHLLHLLICHLSFNNT